MSLSDKIKKIIDNIDDVIEVAVADATNQMFADIDQRTFVKGQAVDGEQMGKYKNGYWKKKREDTGKQVGFVDLDFSGNLERSITRNKNTVFFNNQYGQTVGRGNEDRYRGGGNLGAGKGKIFAPSDEETKRAYGIIRDHVNQLFK